MKCLALFVLACTIGAACGRELQQAAGARAPPSYNTLAQAVAAANASAPNLSILLQAVQVGLLSYNVNIRFLHVCIARSMAQSSREWL